VWGFGELSDSLDGLFSVVEAGLVHNKQALQALQRDVVGVWLPDTLLGFETTSPCPSGWLHVGGVGVLLPCFGGGVWCLIRG